MSDNKNLVSTQGRIHSTDMIMGEGNISKVQTWANILSQSNMVPDHFKGMSTDLCIVTAKALSLGMDPAAMCQEVFPVNNKMTYGSKLIIAMIHASGMVHPRTYVELIGNWDNRGPLQGMRFKNESGLGVKVGFRYIGDNEPVMGGAIFLEDQTTRNSPLWKTDPVQQLTYLAAKRWSSVHLPGVTMGMTTTEEANDELPQRERDITPTMEAEQEVNFSSPAASAEKVVNPQSEEKEIEAEKEVIESGLNEIKAEDKRVNAEAEKVINQKADEEAERKVEQEEVKTDNEGTPFNAEFHTGSLLKDGTWRLNAAGKEDLAAREASAESNSKPKQETIYVKAVHDDSMIQLGDNPLKVVSINDEGDYILEGHESFSYPMVDGETVYLELCQPVEKEEEKDPKPELEKEQKINESLSTLKKQAGSCIVQLGQKLEAATQDPSVIEEVTMEIKGFAKKSYDLLSSANAEGVEVTEDMIKKISESNKDFWSKGIYLINQVKAEEEAKKDSPFDE